MYNNKQLTMIILRPPQCWLGARTARHCEAGMLGWPLHNHMSYLCLDCKQCDKLVCQTSRVRECLCLPTYFRYECSMKLVMCMHRIYIKI